jgi:hypothetical protein
MKFRQDGNPVTGGVLLVAIGVAVAVINPESGRILSVAIGVAKAVSNPVSG